MRSRPIRYFLLLWRYQIKFIFSPIVFWIYFTTQFFNILQSMFSRNNFKDQNKNNEKILNIKFDKIYSLFNFSKNYFCFEEFFYYEGKDSLKINLAHPIWINIFRGYKTFNKNIIFYAFITVHRIFSKTKKHFLFFIFVFIDSKLIRFLWNTILGKRTYAFSFNVMFFNIVANYFS